MTHHDHDIYHSTDADPLEGFYRALPGECDWCGKTSCGCEDGLEGAGIDDAFDDDDEFFDACDENGIPY
jgi:hypothetical protein